MKALIEKINSNGHANGWLAQQLQKESTRLNISMAKLFRAKIENSVAYNVPAKAVKSDSRYVYYEFIDGSKDYYPIPSKG